MAAVAAALVGPVPPAVAATAIKFDYSSKGNKTDIVHFPTAELTVAQLTTLFSLPPVVSAGQSESDAYRAWVTGPEVHRLQHTTECKVACVLMAWHLFRQPRDRKMCRDLGIKLLSSTTRATVLSILYAHQRCMLPTRRSAKVPLSRLDDVTIAIVRNPASLTMLWNSVDHLDGQADIARADVKRIVEQIRLQQQPVAPPDVPGYMRMLVAAAANPVLPLPPAANDHQPRVVPSGPAAASDSNEASAALSSAAAGEQDRANGGAAGGVVVRRPSAPADGQSQALLGPSAAQPSFSQLATYAAVHAAVPPAVVGAVVHDDGGVVEPDGPRRSHRLRKLVEVEAAEADLLTRLARARHAASGVAMMRDSVVDAKEERADEEEFDEKYNLGGRAGAAVPEETLPQLQNRVVGQLGKLSELARLVARSAQVVIRDVMAAADVNRAHDVVGRQMMAFVQMAEELCVMLSGWMRVDGMTDEQEVKQPEAEQMRGNVDSEIKEAQAVPEADRMEQEAVDAPVDAPMHPSEGNGSAAAGDIGPPMNLSPPP